MYKIPYKLAPPALAAGDNTIFLNGVPDNSEGYSVRITVSGKGISDGAAFNSKNPTGANKAARGADDVDKTLAAIFKTIGFTIDGVIQNIPPMDPTRLRTHLSKLNRRDMKVTGLLVDGTSVPISTGAAAAWSIKMNLPIAIARKLLKDGDLLRQGSVRLKKGFVNANVLSLTPTAALANGNMVISNLAWTAEVVINPQGAKSYVGPTYRLTDRQGLVSDKPDLGAGARLYIMGDDETTADTFTIDDPVKCSQVTVDQLNEAWNDEWNPDGSEENTAARAVMMVWPRRDLQFHELDLTPRSPQIKDDNGTNLRLLECFILGRSEAAAQQVATAVGSNGPVTEVKAVPTTHGQAVVPPRLEKLLGKTIIAGSVDIPGATVKASPQSVK